MINLSRFRCLSGGVALAFSLLLPFFSSPANAVESFCPGGASPRSDIIACMDFETACASSSSDTCWTDNGFSSRDDHRGTDMEILTDATRAITGTRYARLRGIGGGTGGGYATYDPASDLSEVRVRWYMTFWQYPHYYFNHFLGVAVSGPGAGVYPACNRGSTLEIGGQSSAYNYGSGDCGYNTLTPNFDTAFDLDLHPNQGNTKVPVFKNGKAYLIEVAIKMDTACTTNTAHGCNGVYKLWVDGDLVISYTDLNWGGTRNGATIKTLDNPRWYRHKRNPMEFPGEIWFDNQVVSNDADLEIGAAAGATNLGTAVAEAMDIGCGIEPFFLNAGSSYSPELDFAGAGYVSICGSPATTWRGNAGVSSTSIYHTGVVTDHGSGGGRPYAEQSMKVECTGANCGAGFYVPRMGAPTTGSEGDGSTNAYRNGALPQKVIHGYLYLPSTSTPNDKIAYPGFFGRGTVAQSNYVAISENTGKWAIIQKHDDGTPGYVVTSAVDVTRDTWHRFELIVWDTEGVSLMIDGVQLYDQQALTNSPTWLFDNSHVADNSGSVFAIIDYIGTGTVTAYLDDVSEGSFSFWNCDGWDANMCPFKEVFYPGGSFAWLF